MSSERAVKDQKTIDEVRAENEQLQFRLDSLQKKYDNVIRELCDAARDEIDRREYVDKLVQENKNLKASLYDATKQGGDSVQGD